MSGEPRRLRRNDLKIASTLPNRTQIGINGIPRSASSSSISRNVLPHHLIRERVSKTSVSARQVRRGMAQAINHHLVISSSEQARLRGRGCAWPNLFRRIMLPERMRARRASSGGEAG